MTSTINDININDCINEPTPVLRLKDAFNLKELIDNSQTEFEVREDELNQEANNEESNFFKYDDLEPFLNTDCVGGEEDNDNNDLTPFQILAKKMVELDDSGKVLKCIKRMGIGKVVPENAVVYIHYNAYTELDEIPYDVTFLRNKEPLRFVLGAAGLIPGLEIGILSMKKSEKAQFLVHPDLAYGKMGCPPRIPPEATILFEVELVRFSDNPIVDGVEEMDMENKQQFSNVIKHAKAEYVIGLGYCKENNPKAASIRFKKALGMLLSSRLKDEEEEKEQKKLLLKLYSNLSACYSDKSLDFPEKVCTYVTDAIRDCGEAARNHVKLQKNWGRALFHLNEFKRASACLRKAKALDPSDNDIQGLLLKVEAKQKQYLENEKIACRRMFGGLSVKEVEKKKEPNQTMTALKEQLEIFKSGKTDSLSLPPGLTSEEEKFCTNYAKSLGLYVRIVERDHVKTVHITKPHDV